MEDGNFIMIVYSFLELYFVIFRILSRVLRFFHIPFTRGVISLLTMVFLDSSFKRFLHYARPKLPILLKFAWLPPIELFSFFFSERTCFFSVDDEFRFLNNFLLPSSKREITMR